MVVAVLTAVKVCRRLARSSHSVCMYVCMSENLYPARLKQKSHSRAAVSNKQKRFQCPFEPFSGQVG